MVGRVGTEDWLDMSLGCLRTLQARIWGRGFIIGAMGNRRKILSNASCPAVISSIAVKCMGYGEVRGGMGRRMGDGEVHGNVVVAQGRTQ